MAIAPDQLGAPHPHLLRLVQSQLCNTTLAGDIVADAILAVLEHPECSTGNASLETYVIGILEHKVIDAIRPRRREVRISLPVDGESGEAGMRSDKAVFGGPFVVDGHYTSPSFDWGDLDATLSRREPFDVLQMCIGRLLPRVGRAFMMCEWLELETDEICRESQTTTINVWALLYRAHIHLREYLDLHWFGNQSAAA